MSDWNVTSIPDNLGAFSQLWDELRLRHQAARIDRRDIRRDIASGVLLDEDEPDVYQIAHHEEVSDKSIVDSMRTSAVPITNYKPLPIVVYVNVRPSAEDRNAIKRTRDEINAHFQEWKLKGFDSVATDICVSQEAPHGIGRKLLLIFPLHWYGEDIDWLAAWIDQAYESDHLEHKRAGTPTSYPFAKAFSNLNRETEGVSSAQLEEIERWLDGRLSGVYKGGQSIEIMNVTIPRAILRTLGIYIILVVQAYAALHLVEAVRRMKRSVPSDPGAYAPWVVLYNGSGPTMMFMCVFVAPAAVSGMVLVRLQEGDPTILGVVVSTIGFSLVLPIAFCNIVNAFRLRKAAEECRGIENDN